MSQLESLLADLEARQFHTPDFNSFKNKEVITLFVYDKYRFGFPDCDKHLHGAQYLGTAMTAVDTYIMKECVADRWNPKVFWGNPKAQQTARVKGDLFRVSPQHLLYLDNELENNMSVFRVQTFVGALDQEIPSHKGFFKGVPSIRAYIYMGMQGRANDKGYQTAPIIPAPKFDFNDRRPMLALEPHFNFSTYNADKERMEYIASGGETKKIGPQYKNHIHWLNHYPMADLDDEIPWGNDADDENERWANSF